MDIWPMIEDMAYDEGYWLGLRILAMLEDIGYD